MGNSIFISRYSPFPQVTTSRLSSLVHTLNSSIRNRRVLDHLPHSYGCYTRTFLLCLAEDLHTLPADIQHLLDKMPRLHTLVICTFLPVIPVHHLSTIFFHAVNPLLIIDQATLQAMLPFQRLYINMGSGSDTWVPEMLQVRQGSLLPNLQVIDLFDFTVRETSTLSQVWDVFKDLIIPRLNSLRLYNWFPPSGSVAVMRFLEVQGPFFGISNWRFVPLFMLH